MADRIVIPFELDKGIAERVDSLAGQFGLVRDEVLRLMIAIGLDEWETHHPAASTVKMDPTSLFGGHLAGLRFAPAQFPPGGPPGDPIQDQAVIMAKIMAAQGALKCPECSQKLKTKDIISGKCPSCQAEL